MMKGDSILYHGSPGAAKLLAVEYWAGIKAAVMEKCRRGSEWDCGGPTASTRRSQGSRSSRNCAARGWRECRRRRENGCSLTR